MRKRWIKVLIDMYPLYPIQNEKDYQKALSAANTLIGKDLDVIARRYLEVLTMLIEHYEQKHFDIETSDLTTIEILKYLCSENDLSASDLGRIFGDRTLGSKVLNGQRDLSKSHIAKLSKYFSVNPGLFF